MIAAVAIFRRFAWLAALALLCAAGPAAGQDYQTRARQALLVDADTGTVLFAKDEKAQIPPASLAKLMTMELVFRALAEKKASLTDSYLVSEFAWRTGGAPSGTATMFAALKSSVALENLIRGVIVQAANDACIIIAEGMAGSEGAFVDKMNERARELGLADSRFVNSTGLPAADQVVSVRDLAKLARHIITTYPERFAYYAEPEFSWNNITQQNRNPLLKMGMGADGMVTGWTKESGFAIVGTARRNDRRLVAVLAGLTSESERAEEARKILDWGFRSFEKIHLFDAGETVGEASVYGGAKPGVALAGKSGIDIYLPIGFRDKLRARVVYTGPLKPPVKAGDKVATLKVWVGEELSQETDLFAAETVLKGGIRRQATDAAKELLFGWIPF
jgi:D-alanyl-D-alanine carboxypeptidase (penicillin-binding protein 5/6)